MRIGILGDVHSNLEALQAVLEAMRNDGVDHWLQVGDVVGYGPDPIPCIEIIQELGAHVCLGNHDAAVVGILDTDYFNEYAQQAVLWTRDHIRDEDREWLRALPFVIHHEVYTLVHGTLNEPEQFGYVMSPVEAKDCLRKQDTLLCFVGHSHVPAIYMERPEMTPHELDVLYHGELEHDTQGCSKILVNVGSVGQPRDEDPRAAYALFDTETGHASIRRVEYDIATTQQKIRSAGLPEMLAHRLTLGV